MTGRLKQRGMTLIELLVTVVILGFAVGLMSGAFSQIAQILRVSTEYSNGFLGRWSQSRALYDMASNMVIDPALETPFLGSKTQLDMVTLALPNGPRGVARRARLRLKSADTDSDRTDLLFEDFSSPDVTAPVKLTNFQGRLEFRYLDHKSQEHSQWPPSGSAIYRALPSAILIRQTESNRLLVRMAAYEGTLNVDGNNLAQALGIAK